MVLKNQKKYQSNLISKPAYYAIELRYRKKSTENYLPFA
jgi:hypothetical protein